MKKLLTIILATLMLVTALPVQSLAISVPDFLKKTIESVELLGDSPVSAKAVSKLIGYEQNNYYLDLDDYQLKMKFSDGSEVTEKLGNLVDWDEVASANEIEADVYVNRDECLELAESGAKTVPVYVDITVCNYSIGHIIDYDTYNFVLEKELVPCIIESITVVSGAPEKYDGEIDDMVIEIVYPDGTKKTAKPERKIRPDVDIFILAGEELEYSVRNRCTNNENCETKILLSYFDSQAEIIYEHEHEPEEVTYFKGIEITDYKMTDDHILKSITYTITWYDGTQKTYTNTFSENDKTEFSTALGNIDGFSIRVKAKYRKPNQYNLNSRVDIDIELKDNYSSEMHIDSVGYKIETEPNFYYHFRKAFAKFMDAITYPIFKLLGIVK